MQMIHFDQFGHPHWYISAAGSIATSQFQCPSVSPELPTL